MAFHKAYEFRDRAGSLRRMARETTDARARKALNDLAAENIAKAEELEALTNHEAPPLQPKPQRSS
jgi:hypothetical protein